MSAPFAFECYGDQDVFHVLRRIGLRLRPVHSFSQGEVINDVLRRGKAPVGLVDEDPGRTHHSLRDQMKRIEEGLDLDLLSMNDRYLILVKPNLEQCFYGNLKKLNLQSQLAEGPQDLHRMLGLPRGKKHDDFREELWRLYEASKARRVPVFLSGLEDFLRRILGSGTPAGSAT